MEEADLMFYAYGLASGFVISLVSWYILNKKK